MNLKGERIASILRVEVRAKQRIVYTDLYPIKSEDINRHTRTYAVHTHTWI
jgi:hypothetical protein